MPGAFHCDFSIDTLGISLRFFKWSPGHFIAVFQMYPWIFHCNSSNVSHMSGSMQWASLEGGHMMNYQKWSKMKVVALHCSFPNLFELCFEVLPLWRYEVKEFQKC